MRVTLLVLIAVLVGCGTETASPPDTSAPPHFDRTDSPDAAVRLAQGERMTWILGCRGCHSAELTGQAWDDDPKGYGILWAPNLTRAAQQYGDEGLRRIIFDGVHPARKDLWVMPSDMFQRLPNSDRSALVDYLKSLTPVGKASPLPVPGPLAKAEIAAGRYKPAAMIASERKAVLPYDAGPEFALGRYIASASCTECHGPTLEGQGSPEGSTPDLAAAAAYSRAEFEALTTRGEPKDKRKIDDLMVSVGKNRLSRLTPHERDALYAYLVARANRPQ